MPRDDHATRLLRHFAARLRLPVPASWAPVDDAPEAVGASSTARLVLVGRPTEVTYHTHYVLFRLRGDRPGIKLQHWQPALALGAEPTDWTVLTGRQSWERWKRLEEALAADPQDRLRVEGYPCLRHGKLVLLADVCISVEAALEASRAEMRARRALRRAAGDAGR